jgi:transposase
MEKLNIGLASVNQIIAGLDYARPHTNAATSAAIQNVRFEVVPHRPYRPDLVSPDFWLFAALKKYLKEIHFTCDEEVQAAMEK